MTNPRFGVTGLATMGQNLSRNIARHGFPVAVHNRSSSRTKTLVDRYGDEGTFVASESLSDFVASIEAPRTIIIMVKAGDPTDAVIDELVPLLEPDDVVVDGGNAHFLDTRRREAALREHGLHFVGAGISGGEEGALNGPSIMPGGSEHSWDLVRDLFTSIAAQVDGEPCCTYIGPDGAGHFVKMVHNGIEYADMQLIAEAYDLMRVGLGMTPAEIGDTFASWNEGDLDSFLIEITARVLRHVDAETGRPFVDVVADRAEQKGTGRWTVQTALDLGVSVSGIAEAVFARSLSGSTPLREAARGALSGPQATLSDRPREDVLADIRAALYASKVVAYAQGFDEITAGSTEYDWDLEPGPLATIWRGGCIIRARFLDRIREAYDAGAPATLLAAPYFADVLTSSQDGWRRVVAEAVQAGIPVPGFSAALGHYDGARAERLPAALVQGLRDLFGAHTYERTDKSGSFHTLWSEDETEVEA